MALFFERANRMIQSVKFRNVQLTDCLKVNLLLGPTDSRKDDILTAIVEGLETDVRPQKDLRATIEALLQPESAPQIAIETTTKIDVMHIPSAFFWCRNDAVREWIEVLTDFVSFLDERGSEGVILASNPGLRLDPDGLFELLKDTIAVTKNRPIQIFMALDNLEAVAIVGELTDQTSCKAYRLKRDGSASWFDHDNLIAWLKQGMDPRRWGEPMLRRTFWSWD